MLHAGTDYSFGPFRLSPERRLLLDGQQAVRIGSRAFDLLSLLVEQAGEVVDKEALIKRAWPKVVVEQTSLRFHIAMLRKLLGDGQDGARYITNISGRGYCFVAPVQRGSPSLDHSATPSIADDVSLAPQNLPVRLTRMVGRQTLLRALAAQLPQQRIVTIVATGGMGKSTLALALAEQLLPQYPQGVWFIDLSMLKEEALVASTVATTLNIGVNPQDALPRLLTELRHHRMLLLLDNCEHVRQGVASVVDALLANTGIHVLATSREALGAHDEAVSFLPSLPTPSPGEARTAAEALTYAAVQLFVERAIASQDSFELSDAEAEAASEICRRLDGMPLALELAAARMDAFGVHGLLRQLKDQFELPAGPRRGAPDRHRTLKALLDWSYAMLSPTEQHLLRQVSIFCGPFDQDALHRVLTDGAQGQTELQESMRSLVSRSLVTMESGPDHIRYRLLDTTRVYALDRLRLSDEHTEVRRRHAGYLCHALSESTHDWISMPREALMQKYAHLVDEVRAALDWALAPEGDAPAGLTLLIVAAGPLGHLVTHPEEFVARTQQALQLQALSRVQDPALEYRLHALLATLSLLSRGPNTLSEQAFEQATQMADQLGDKRLQAESCNGRFIEAFGSGRYDEALRHAVGFSNAVADSPDTMHALADARLRALCLHFLGHHEQAVPLIDHVLRHTSPVVRVGPGYPYDRRVSMRILLARTLWIQGMSMQAIEVATEALEHAEREQSTAMSHALAWAACPIALWNGERDSAAAHIEHLLSHSTLHRRAYWAGWGSSYRQILDGAAHGDAPPHKNHAFSDTPLTNSTSLCDMLTTLDPGYLTPPTLARVKQGTVGWCSPEILRAAGDRARFSTAANPDARAEELYQDALDSARAQGALGWELRAATSLARLKAAQQRRAEAQALLEPCYQRFTEGWQHADLRTARALLEDLAT